MNMLCIHQDLFFVLLVNAFFLILCWSEVTWYSPKPSIISRHLYPWTPAQPDVFFEVWRKLPKYEPPSQIHSLQDKWDTVLIFVQPLKDSLRIVKWGNSAPLPPWGPWWTPKIPKNTQKWASKPNSATDFSSFKKSKRQSCSMGSHCPPDEI